MRHRKYAASGTGTNGNRRYHSRRRKRQPTRKSATPVAGFFTPRHASASASPGQEDILERCTVNDPDVITRSEATRDLAVCSPRRRLLTTTPRTMFFQILSILGAAMVLFAYAANQRGRLTRDDTWYNVLNLVGSTLLTIVAVIDR